MGLTISYTIKAHRDVSEDTLLEWAQHTALFAKRIGCKEVWGPQFGGPPHWKLWELPDGAVTGEPVSALEGWSVNVWPGDGCERADFGLCRYPDIPHWKLSSFCKTQYAARYGPDHFLYCHRRIVSLLDLWRDFGVELEVCDEGEYWESRSTEQLREKVAHYDRLVAAVAGTLSDQTEEGRPAVEAAIFEDIRFERLEAEGRKEFAAQLEQMRKLLD